MARNKGYPKAKTNSKPKDENFRGPEPSEKGGGVSKPTMSGAGNAAPSNASNSASPKNPGNMNLLRKVNSSHGFKTGFEPNK